MAALWETGSQQQDATCPWRFHRAPRSQESVSGRTFSPARHAHPPIGRMPHQAGSHAPPLGWRIGPLGRHAPGQIRIQRIRLTYRRGAIIKDDSVEHPLLGQGMNVLAWFGCDTVPGWGVPIAWLGSAKQCEPYGSVGCDRYGISRHGRAFSSVLPVGLSKGSRNREERSARPLQLQ